MSDITDFILLLSEFMEDKPYVSFILLLLVNNAVLFCAWYKDKKYRAIELVKLEQEAKIESRKYTIEELKEEIKPQPSFTWTFCICICLDIWIVGAYLTHLWAAHYFKEVKEGDSNKALFGDSFGAVNALISAFAFAGMLVAFFLQRYELRLQRKELQLTRDEMNEQTAQFKKQNDTLQKERFESTFFHMLELQQQIVNELSTNQTEEIRRDFWDGYISFSKDFPVDQNISGRNLFFHSFCNIIHEIPTGDSNEVRKVRGLKEVLEKYGFFYYKEMSTPTYFDHYFRHLYTILKFINKYDVPEEEKRIMTDEDLYGYAKILRATLSRYELVWLFYNGLSLYGNRKLKPLIEKYCMLKNLREDLLACSKENQGLITKAGLTIEKIRESKFSGTDYEFFITSERGDKTRYHVSAFYNTSESQGKASQRIEEWKIFSGNK